VQHAIVAHLAYIGHRTLHHDGTAQEAINRQSCLHATRSEENKHAGVLDQLSLAELACIAPVSGHTPTG